MTAEAHQLPEFTNAARWTVAVTFTVAGGARARTAGRRARKVAERLANAAARAGGVVEVTAVAGPSTGEAGEMRVLCPERVRFAVANSGQGSYAEPGKLDRYLDPEHERALASLRAADVAYRARQRADRQRREALGCRNACRVGLPGERWDCRCVYCRPDEHLTAREVAAEGPRWSSRGCVCGTATPAGGPCLRHRDVCIVALDGDPEVLQELAALAGDEPDARR